MDHVSGFGTNGAEAEFYRPNRTSSAPFDQNAIFGDKEPFSAAETRGDAVEACGVLVEGGRPRRLSFGDLLRMSVHGVAVSPAPVRRWTFADVDRLARHRCAGGVVFPSKKLHPTGSGSRSKRMTARTCCRSARAKASRSAPSRGSPVYPHQHRRGPAPHRRERIQKSLQVPSEGVLGHQAGPGPDGVETGRPHECDRRAGGPQQALDVPATLGRASADGAYEDLDQVAPHAIILSRRGRVIARPRCAESPPAIPASFERNPIVAGGSDK